MASRPQRRRIDVLSEIAGKFISLAHFIFGKPPSGKCWDHANRNTFDCRDSNMRLIDRADNASNASLRVDNLVGLRGVFTDRTRWRSCVHHKKIRYTASHGCRFYAAAWFNDKAIELRGTDMAGHLNKHPISGEVLSLTNTSPICSLMCGNLCITTNWRLQNETD